MPRLGEPVETARAEAVKHGGRAVDAAPHDSQAGTRLRRSVDEKRCPGQSDGGGRYRCEEGTIKTSAASNARRRNAKRESLPIELNPIEHLRSVEKWLVLEDHPTQSVTRLSTSYPDPPTRLPEPPGSRAGRDALGSVLKRTMDGSNAGSSAASLRLARAAGRTDRPQINRLAPPRGSSLFMTRFHNWTVGIARRKCEGQSFSHLRAPLPAASIRCACFLITDTAAVQCRSNATRLWTHRRMGS